MVSTEYRKILEQHFKLLGYIEQYYQEGNYNRCIKYCIEDIKNFPKFKDAYIASELDMHVSPLTGRIEDNFSANDVIIPQIGSFETLAKIYEKQGLYDQGMQVCQLAIQYGLTDGTKGGFQGRLKRLERKKAQPNTNTAFGNHLAPSYENIPDELTNYALQKVRAISHPGLSWYVSISFGDSTSSNFSKAIALAKQAYRYIEDTYEGSKIYQAIFTQEPSSYLKFIQLYELISDWKSTFVIINGEIVDRKIVGGLNYCYGDKCRSGQSNFCYGASYMTANPFGCHRLQISRYNHPWWEFSSHSNGYYHIDKARILKRAEEYGTPYRNCPCFDFDSIKQKINSLPDQISERDYQSLSQPEETRTIQISINPSASHTSNLNGNQTVPAYPQSSKSFAVTLLLCILFGLWGIHRFYVGKVGTGIIWLFTAGCFGIGWIYDFIKILSGTFTDGTNRIIK